MAPKCPLCHKTMKPRHKVASGFDEILDVILEAISTYGKSILAPTKFGCVGKIPNPKFKEYLKEKQKEEQRGAVGKAVASLTGNKSKLPKNPPPAMIPCPNHHNLKVTGDWNEKISKKGSKPLFNNGGHKIIGGGI